MTKKHSWIRSNQGIGTILAVLFFGMYIYLEFASWAEQVARDDFSLGFFPKIATGLLIFFSIIMIVDSRRNVVLEKVQFLSISTLFYTISITIYCMLIYIAMEKIGYLISTPVLIFPLIYILGLKSLIKSFVYSLLISIIIFAIFTGLGVSLPSGILPF